MPRQVARVTSERFQDLHHLPDASRCPFSRSHGPPSNPTVSRRAHSGPVAECLSLSVTSEVAGHPRTPNPTRGPRAQGFRPQALSQYWPKSPPYLVVDSRDEQEPPPHEPDGGEGGDAQYQAAEGGRVAGEHGRSLGETGRSSIPCGPCHGSRVRDQSRCQRK